MAPPRAITPNPPALHPTAAATLDTSSTPASALHPPTTPATLRVSLSKSPRQSPQPLTGAAALAEQREQRARGAQSSPNPAQTALNALLASESMSRPRDGPPAPTAQMSEPLKAVAKSIVIPENVTSENIHTSPVSLSSFGSAEGTTAPTATAIEAVANGPFPVDQSPQVQAGDNGANHTISHSQENANRSFTFPGLPPDQDPRGPQRGMSLPGYQNSPKSPSTKRHKCPYCSTDFTRHHNLKSHLLTHSQEKPYECQDCHARFRRLHDLKRHAKLHTGERNHICPKCNRRFARGDALARHNKGNGGCAGRRSSFGMNDEMGDGRGEDAMDGLEYQHPESEENAQPDGTRRISEPSRRDSTRHGSASFPHGSTYPPVLAAARGGQPTNGVRPIYPPPNNIPREQSMGVSPKGGSSLSSIHFGAAQSAGFHSGGMTESPKPLSPGQPDHRGLQGDTSMSGTRSPSMSQHMNPQQFSRGAGRGNSPMSLPPPAGHPNAPQLPQLPGLAPGTGTTDPRLMHPSANKPSISIGGHGSNPGSISSHGASSGGSMREILGTGRNDSDLWTHIRKMEDAHAQRQKESDARIAQLERELMSVRAQLVQQQGQTSLPEAPQPGR